MNNAIISILGGICLACLTYFFSKKTQTDSEWRHEKMNHYKVLFSSLSDIASESKNKSDAYRSFTLAANTICLIAPQYVVIDLMRYLNEVEKKCIETQNQALVKLVLSVRKDIGLSKSDDEKTFDFRIIRMDYK